MKFTFYTLGCKVNRFETQALEQMVLAQGHDLVSNDADICVINTCTVTTVSDHKNIRIFHKMRKNNPRAIIAACGCFAQMSPDKVRALPEIDLICGTGERAAIIERCIAAATGKADHALPEAPPRTFELLPAGIPQGRTRALLKVQDGCDNYCSYCVIPYARGHVRSMPLDQVRAQTLKLVSEGAHEIVLTGIEIASYGTDIEPPCNLTKLVATVCEAAKDVRIRLSSLEPRAVDEHFCKTLSAYPNLVRHFHLSLQSGCDRVLQRMRRKYSTEQFYRTTERLRDAFPHCSITTDLIVGFPGETEDEFAETMRFIRKCRFASMHVFPYSPREGTVAATMDGQVSDLIKSQRAEAVKGISKEMENTFLQQFVGHTVEVLLEHACAQGSWSGHSAFHFPVRVKTRIGGKNRKVSVLVTELTAETLIGKEI